MDQREEGGYQVHHWIDGSNVNWIIEPNINRHIDPDDPATHRKAELLREDRFRKALSHAIDRERLIDLAFHGWGTPSQGAPRPGSRFDYPSLREAYLERDPERAGALLDSLGLDRIDSEGCRTFPDGSRMTWFLLYPSTLAGPAPLLVQEDLREDGLRLIPRELSTALFTTTFRSLDYDLAVWQMPAMPEPFGDLRHYVPTSRWTVWAPGYGSWYDQGGYYAAAPERFESGFPPPQGHILWEAWDAFDQLKRTRDPDQWGRELDRIYDIARDQLWNIGVATSPPVVAVVANDLRNVPRSLLNIIKSPHNGSTETWFFDEPSLDPAARGHLQKLMTSVEDDHVTPANTGASARSFPSILGKLLRILAALSLLAAGMLVVWRHPFIAQRLAIMVPILLVISVVVFAIIQMPPGSFLDTAILRAEMEGDPGSLARVDEIRRIFPLDQPFLQQYADWMGLRWFLTFDREHRGLLQGDLGRSMETLQPVNELVGDRFLLTFCISLGTILFTWMTALPIGVYSAVRQYSPGDYVVSVIGFIGMSVPNFLLAILLMYGAKVTFDLNVSGLFSPEFAAQAHWDFAKFIDLLKHIWVPVIVLGTGGTASMIRVMRANLLDELRKPYVTTARAKGVRPGRLLLKYPVRLALNPFVSSIGGIFPALISGGAIVGIVLSLPTIGPLQLTAILSEDYYLAGSLLMLLSLLGVFGTLVSDLLLLWLDPRIRMEGGGR